MKAIKVLDDGLQLAEGERQIYLTYLRGKQTSFQVPKESSIYSS